MVMLSISSDGRTKLRRMARPFHLLSAHGRALEIKSDLRESERIDDLVCTAAIYAATSA